MYVISFKVLTKKEGSNVCCDADKMIYNVPTAKKDYYHFVNIITNIWHFCLSEL